MLAKLTDAPFDDRDWIFEDKYDGFRMIATIEGGQVTLYSRNGKIISDNYFEVAKALEGIKHDAVIDGELVAIGIDGLSHFQLLQNARRHEAKLQYCAFDLMFQDGDDLRGLSLLERKPVVPSRTETATTRTSRRKRVVRQKPPNSGCIYRAKADYSADHCPNAHLPKLFLFFECDTTVRRFRRVPEAHRLRPDSSTA